MISLCSQSRTKDAKLQENFRKHIEIYLQT